MEEKVVTQDVLDKVKEVADKSGFSCPEARKLAEELDVPPQVIGQACNKLGIKIKGCSLGCF